MTPIQNVLKDHKKILTKREQDVFLLMLFGYRRQAIADQLCICDAGVRAHTTNILKKFQKRDRFELLSSIIQAALKQELAVDSLPAPKILETHHN